MDVKTFAFQVKGVDVEEGIFSGYASTFGVRDEYGDVVMPGAFAKTLQENAQRVRVCWMHGWDNPIGKPVVMEEHGRDRLPRELLERAPEATGGLYVEARISQTTQGRDALVLMRDGVVDELSIGYDPIKTERGELNGEPVNYLRELRLWEFSPVTWGANHAALVTGMKALGLPPDVLGGLRMLIAQPDGVDRLGVWLSEVRSAAEPLSAEMREALTARIRVLSLQVNLLGGR